MGDNEFRDVAALFAMWKMVWDEGEDAANALDCFRIADAMLAARNKPVDGGIAAIKKRRIKGER